MPTKLFPNLVQAVVNCLQDIFGEGKYADRAIEYTLKSNPKWGARDRAFIAESTYEIVRYWRLYWAISGRPPQLDDDSLWQIFGIYWVQRGENLPTWQQFRNVPEKKNAEEFENPAIRHSYPDWLHALANQELGEQWQTEMQALNQPAEVVLRANTLKISKKSLQKQLAEMGIETTEIPQLPDALLLKKRQNLFNNPLFQAGCFEVQDASSQLIAPFMDLKAGMRVIDACAGAGGKSLHMAAQMQNKGKLIAMDVEDYKLQELRKRAKRAGVEVIETRKIENSKSIKRLEGSADAVLLDVPCSGLGVLRRNPDAKWKLQASFIEKIRQTQAEILASYSRMLAKGGTLVYATCSILPSENTQQVHQFLNNQGKEFELIEEKIILPSVFGFDGFYMAKLKK